MNIVNFLYERFFSKTLPSPVKEASGVANSDTQEEFKTSMRVTNYFGLNQKQQDLVSSAAQAMKNTLNPYSKFHVGSAVLGDLGSKEVIVGGANQENSSYGLTICAERSALFTARNQGLTNIKSIAIIAQAEQGDKPVALNEPTFPCGACRQVINDFAQLNNSIDGNIEVIVSNTDKSKIYITTIKDLLPKSFGPRDLNIDLSKSKGGRTVEDFHRIAA